LDLARESVDDEALAARLERLILALPSEGVSEDTPIARAIRSGEPREVLALGDFGSATPEQRLGLLRILLEMSFSSDADERKILDILAGAGSGLSRLMSDLEALALKEALFEHIDGEENRARLTSLLTPLDDPELRADLEVLNRGVLENLWEGISGGAVQAWEEFSRDGVLTGVWRLIVGMLQPILHPIDTIVNLVNEATDFVEQPSWDGLLRFARDLTGAISMGLLAISGVLMLASLASAGLGVLTGPGAIFAESIAATLAGWAAVAFAWAGILGVAFLAIAGVKALVDLVQASTSVTARSLEREQEQISEDLTLFVVVGLFWGFLRALKSGLGWIRGSAVEPAPLDENALNDRDANVEAADDRVRSNVDGLDRAAGGSDTSAGAPEPARDARAAPEPARDAPAPDPYQQLADELGLSRKRVRLLRANQIDLARLRTLLERGVNADELTQRAAEFGNGFLRVVEALLDRRYDANRVLRVAADAARSGTLTAVELLARSPRFLNPNALDSLLHRGSRVLPGLLRAIRQAAARVERGHRVSLEERGDIVDLTTREVVQLKEVTSPRADQGELALEGAAEQVRGQSGETPPRGFARIVDVLFTSERNPWHAADEAGLLELLRTLKRMHGIDRVRITNGQGTFEFESPAQDGNFEPYRGRRPIPIRPIGTSRDEPASDSP
jgi:hypothetical protein